MSEVENLIWGLFRWQNSHASWWKYTNEYIYHIPSQAPNRPFDTSRVSLASSTCTFANISGFGLLIMHS